MADAFTGGQPVDDALYRRISDFYFDEAELLSQRHYNQWFALLAQDVHYRVLFPEFYEHGAKRPVGMGNPYLDDDHTSLKVRTELLGNPLTTTAENPPSVYNYFVTNIRAWQAADNSAEIVVHSRLLIYRVRASEPVPYILGARRQDRLRPEGQSFLIALRDTTIDQAVLQSPNMSFLF